VARYPHYSYFPPRAKKPADPTAKIEKLRRENPDIEPVVIEGKIAKTWWGSAWNKNLESYSDYANRLPRGRTYVRNGSVVDLKVHPGEVRALVAGSRSEPYRVRVSVDLMEQHKWVALVKHCSRRVGSLEELVAGKFPEELVALFSNRGDGLFPLPSEIHFSCSCPDDAVMCKHVAAVLYGIGARFDKDPTLLFLLRNINFSELIKKSVDDKISSMLANADVITDRVISDIDTLSLFGV